MNSFSIIFYVSFSIFLVGFLFQTLRLINKTKVGKEKLYICYSALAFIFTTIGILGETFFMVISWIFKEEILTGLIVSYIFLILNCFSTIVNFYDDLKRKRYSENIRNFEFEDDVIYVDGEVVSNEDKVESRYLINNRDN